MTARIALGLGLGLALLGAVTAAQDLNVQWIHGSDPCSANTDPPFQVHKYDENTVMLRENKCINYEGPFIYLLFGEDKIFMQDTGAAPAASSGSPFPVRETVQRVIDEWASAHGKHGMTLLVTHSHAHGDHTGGDGQFAGQPSTVLVGTKLDDVQRFFGITDWPTQQVTLDLGGRILDVLPIPGHEPTSVAVYDRRTRLLLTGDTLYPGRLYVRDWPAYRASVGRLAAFARAHDVSHVLGTHIEMTSTSGVDYPIRTTFQPKEHDLALTPAHLFELEAALLKMPQPARDVHPDFIIDPR